jgi:very-short-patch-repair endonuclease
VGDLHENKIDKFIKLDQELLILNRKRITQQISQKRPIIGGETTKRSELGILLSEFNRKRRHMPIRKLLSAAGGLIQEIKPCFMMSPLSVAQFIEPENVDNLLFDVIIFDEASQVKPEDALGAFLRGKHLVVMGDTKQLPPTSFFENMVEADDDEDYELSSLKDMESILHLCKKSGFPTKMLRWHYRSRHESLIAVSNHLFYSNQLLIYPSPSNESEKLGLKFIHLPDAIYDSGRNSGNIIEAKAVVKAIIEHYQTYGNTKSLGVGTFNLNQRRLIDDFLEIERKKNPDIEEYFTEKKFEKFFIKNLETIQGDERDVIFVSVGFGFDKNHKLSHNFGPVNREGGERRLNVLFTRAREKCVIFSNFKHSDLKLASNAPFGLRALKTFLEYAENRQLIEYESPRENTESSFEETVFEFLKNTKYEVHKQVGCAGFRIDLAIVDPNSQGEYLLGIECDGATYHSSPVARDRDRLRQQVLEGLGWKIHRIWSTDWYRNREETTNRLLKAIDDAEKIDNKTEINIPEEKIVLDDETLLEEDNSRNEKLEELFESTVDNEINKPALSIEDPVSDYETCHTITIDKSCPLTEKSSLELSEAIIQIVNVEGPIHINEVIKRVRICWGLKKAGKRIKDAIKSAVEVAGENGQVIIKDNFIYPITGKVSVRRRTGDPPANIDLISSEEIEEAIKIVLKTQHATPLKDLYTQVARLFGFKSTSKKTANQIKTSIQKLLDEEQLVETSNGMINIIIK